MNDAVWECRMNFETLWGEKLLNTIRSIHNFLYSGKEIEDKIENTDKNEERDTDEWFISKRQKDLKGEDDEEKNLEPFIYHLKDERLLHSGLSKDVNVEYMNESAFITPFPLDRRIERQFSVFTFHPHPSLNPTKIPIDKYKISGELFMEMFESLEGMGFSSSHLFPDYAGLADRIKQGFMI